MSLLLPMTMASGFSLQHTKPAHLQLTKPSLVMRVDDELKARLIGAALATTINLGSAGAAEPWAYSTLLSNIDSDNVAKLNLAPNALSATAFDQAGNTHDVSLFPGASTEIVSQLREHKSEFAVIAPSPPPALFQALGTLGGLLVNFAPLLFLFGLSFLARGGMPGGGGGGSGGPGGVGKSRSQIQMEPNTGVRFEDVAGCDGSKQELTEIVDFLKNPAKYAALGAKIPKGAVMEGPPGTGKTLLARAVAGEAGVPFISASGSEFVEMFVGVGASRVRDLFKQAKENAPCIVFIDEIDAIGGQRAGGGGGGMGGGNDEREQTLNQILTEMDGFAGDSGVIVLAATNRADMLDSALVRPGRFDRRVPVDLPDVKGRRAILDVHARGKPLADGVDLNLVAKRTTGFSGASLANLLNEAAIVAARRSKNAIGYEEIDYAIDRVTVGMQKATGTSFPARQRLVAYHEAGHAVMGLLLPDYDQVTKVTIIPRTNGAGGFTLFTPSDEMAESGMYSKRYLQGQLAVALGGRVAEELVFGADEVTTGASSDLQQVRNIARRMVAQWGFAMDSLGAVAWETPEGNGMMGPRAASPDTEAAIDVEVQALVSSAYERTVRLLTEHRALMEEMVERLLDEETLDYEQLEEMRARHVAALSSAAPPAKTVGAATS